MSALQAPGRRTALLLAALGLLLPALVTPATGAPAVSSGPAGAVEMAARDKRPAVLGKRVIGRSVQDRPIIAWHLGERRRRGIPRVVLIAGMHGDERAPRRILWALRDGRPIRGIDLWVVPQYNPDGLAAGTRRNARGVDLNRNYPQDWADLDGSHESGPRPGSEPETRAMARFLRKARPRWLLSFHQPLHGVDTDTKRPVFSRKVARALDLPRKRFDCGGVCHGTMTSWYNARFPGTALTVEYGDSPPRRLMTRKAPRQVLSLFGGKRQRPS